jgi:hypothetical protein
VHQWIDARLGNVAVEVVLETGRGQDVLAKYGIEAYA